MEKLYSVKQVCDLLQITRFTFRNWEKANKLNVIRINGHPRVKESELQRLLRGE